MLGSQEYVRSTTRLTQAIQEEIMALEQNETWELVTLSLEKKVVGCKWIYTVKLTLMGLWLT